jgi:hypothetical protein
MGAVEERAGAVEKEASRANAPQFLGRTQIRLAGVSLLYFILHLLYDVILIPFKGETFRDCE